MFKVYNNYSIFVNGFYDFFSSFSSRKTFLNFFPDFLFGLIHSESVTLSDISLSLSHIHPDIKLDSIEKRCSRFLHNPNFPVHHIFNQTIEHIISNFKFSHSDSRRFYVSFDHMFVQEKHTVLMFSLRIGKQGIPLYFKTFPGKGQNNHGNAFKIKNIIDGINYCHDLLKSYHQECEIIFLADRWFGNLFPLLDHIDSLGDLFVFRGKKNMKVHYFSKKENHYIWTNVENLPHYAYKSNLFYDLELTHEKHFYNLAYCKSKDHNESWILITNDNPKFAKKHYGYRFGSIEFIFKSQKTNGFYLEETKVMDYHAFENLYSIICLASLFLTCLGTDISKNSKSYINIGFRITRKNSKTNNIYRAKSRFRTGLTLFKLALSNPYKYRLPFTFILYDS